MGVEKAARDCFGVFGHDRSRGFRHFDSFRGRHGIRLAPVANGNDEAMQNGTLVPATSPKYKD
jgi:hypothetical protein